MMREFNGIEILGIKDLMDCMKIGRDKAYSLMKSKSFPSMKIGKTYIVTSANLNRWLDENAGRNIII